MKKITFPIDKRHWQPSLIPGPVVLISTYDKEGHPNIAPKSWVQMVSFEPPILMFSGTKENTTEINIRQTGCFGVNVVDDSLAEKVFSSVQWYGQERIERTGFSVSKASTIEAPLVDDCKAHLECRLHSTHEIGSGYIVFGEIVAASVWDKVIQAKREEKYRLLNQILFLEDKLYSTVEKVIEVNTD